MNKRNFFRTLSAIGVTAVFGGPAAAQSDTFKVGLVLPMTGAFASIGKQSLLGAQLYVAQHGDRIAGKKLELIVKDDASTPDVTRRLTQELLANERVNVLSGFLLTSSALAAAPLATQSKTPLITWAGASVAVTQSSPYVVRSSFTLGQVALGIADWAPQNGIKRVITLVSDYSPGLEAEKYFSERFSFNGGTVLESIRVPVRNPDFAPFLQRVREAKPDAIFVFVPAGVNSALMKQFVERGLDKAGIRLIGTGDITDDDILGSIGDAALGVVTSHHYSVAHNSALNKKFVEAFRKANNGLRPNFMAVAAYDGMKMVYEAATKAKGVPGGEALLDGLKGLMFESPRGTMLIDAQTRGVIQDVYVRRVEKVNGELYNVEFSTIRSVKDPSIKN